jgi:hypothetical protein
MTQPFSRNPRKITDIAFAQLSQDLEQLGDLGGIVHDLNSDEWIGGNQRAKVFGSKIEPVITATFDPPTRTGTVAIGYIEWRGERYAYRAVRWSPEKCAAANVKANLDGGTWDFTVFTEKWVSELQNGELEAMGINQIMLAQMNADANALRDMLNFQSVPVDVDKEWQGMPSFVQEQKAVRSIIVHFKTREDVAAFEQAVGQKISDRAKFIWYPQLTDEELRTLGYESVEVGDAE